MAATLALYEPSYEGADTVAMRAQPGSFEELGGTVYLVVVPALREDDQAHKRLSTQPSRSSILVGCPFGPPEWHEASKTPVSSDSAEWSAYGRLTFSHQSGTLSQ